MKKKVSGFLAVICFLTLIFSGMFVTVAKPKAVSYTHLLHRLTWV